MTVSSTDLLHRPPPPAPAPRERDDLVTRPPVGLRAYLASSGAIPLVIALAIVAIFVPALTAHYAFSDDYPVLYIADGLGSNYYFGASIIDTVSASGRPLAGLLDQLFFSAAGTIDNLWFVRLVGVVGIVALALLVHWALVRARIELKVGALIAVLMCTQPAFLVFGSWAVLFNVPYAAILGGVASLLVGSATRERQIDADKAVGAGAVLLAGIFIYQSGAMFFWVFLAIALVGARHDVVQTKRLVRVHLVVAAAALAVAYLTTKLIVHSLNGAAPNAARSALVHDVLGKIRWFVRWPLYQALNLFDLNTAPWLAGAVVIVAIAGIALAVRREGIRPIPLLAFGAGLIPLAFLPSLVVAENSPTYRVQVALTSLVALYLSLGAIGVWLAARDRLRQRITGTALLRADRLALAAGIVFVGVSCAVAARNVWTLIVEPQSTELRIMRSQVAAVPTGAQQINFVQLDWYQGLTSRWYSDELGLASAARPWTPQPAVYLILREEGRLPPDAQRPFVNILPWTTTTIPDNVPVINLRVLQELR